MHHPSWLFPGKSKIYRPPSPSDEASAGDRPRNNGSTDVRSNDRDDQSNCPVACFDINSFVRSLNRNAIKLPESFIFKGTSGGNNASKCLNDFLSVANDSVDRVVIDTDSKIRSDYSSSFGSLQSSSNEDRDAAAWNDLIHMVSATAHEFRIINNADHDQPTTDAQQQRIRPDVPCSCHRLEISGRSNEPRSNIDPTSGLSLSKTRTWNHKLSQERESVDDPSMHFGIGDDKTKVSEIYPDVIRTNDDTRPQTEEITYSEHPPTSPNNETRGQIGKAASLRMIHCRIETSNGTLNEVLGATRNSTDDIFPSCLKSQQRGINSEAFLPRNDDDFPPYFTGGPSKTFGLRPKVDRDSFHEFLFGSRFASISRSSPIFVDAGEATADNVADSTWHDPEKWIEGSSSDSRPTRLMDEKVARPSDAKGDLDISPPIISEEEEESPHGASRRADHNEKSRGRKVWRQKRRAIGQTRCAEEQTEDEENNSDRDSCRTRKYPQNMILVRKNKRPSNETQLAMSSKVQSSNNPRKFIDDSGGKGSTAVEIKPRIIVRFENKTRRSCAILSEKESNGPPNGPARQASTGNHCNSLLDPGRRVDCRKNDRDRGKGDTCEKFTGKPDGTTIIASSPSASSLSKQSRIAQLAGSKSRRQSIDKSPEQSRVPFKYTARTVLMPTTELQRAATAKEKAKIQILQAESRKKVAPKSLGGRAPLGDERCKPMTNKRATTAVDSNISTNPPALRSKTFVHRMKRELDAKRCTSEKDYSRDVAGNSTSVEFHRNCTTDTGPTKQSSADESWKNLTHTRTTVGDLSSNINFDDTPLDSRINTDTELSRSVSAVSDSDLKTVSCNVRFSSDDSVIAERVNDTRIAGTVNSETAATKSPFRNRHARSLRMLKSILSHRGVNVESVNRDATAIRSRISNDTSKNSRVPVGTERNKSSSIIVANKHSPKTSRMLFEKLAILAESQPERSNNGDTGDSPGRLFSSFIHLASDSVTSCTKSTRDAGDQCSIDRESCMVSVMSMRSNKSSCSTELSGEQEAAASSEISRPSEQHFDITRVDIGLSPVQSGILQVAETQTRIDLLDKNSITDEIPRPVMSCVSTETETVSANTREAYTDCRRWDCYKATKETASGKDFVNVSFLSKQVNTENPDVFVMSRGVCFHGARRINASCQVVPFVDTKDTACGKDCVAYPGISEFVNTDPLDYLYVDRSVEVLGPKTTHGACQIDSQLEVVDVAVRQCSRDTATSSCNFCTIGILNDINFVDYQSSTNARIPRFRSSDTSNSSLVALRCLSAENSLPPEAIAVLKMIIQRSQNLFKALDIYRENLSGERATMEHESLNIGLSTTAKIEEDYISRFPPSWNKDGPRFSNSENQVADAIDDLLINVTRQFDKENTPVEYDNEGGREIPRARNAGNEEYPSSIYHKRTDFSFLSRNSLLTIVYGTVCSFVFWALQFSITCDSL